MSKTQIAQMTRGRGDKEIRESEDQAMELKMANDKCGSGLLPAKIEPRKALPQFSEKRWKVGYGFTQHFSKKCWARKSMYSALAE